MGTHIDTVLIQCSALIGMLCHEEMDRKRDQMGGSEQGFFFLGGRRLFYTRPSESLVHVC